MKSQSVTGLPAIEWKKLCSGPTSTLERKPLVGDPPWIQARALGVEKPRPKVLSRKAQRKMNPVAMRRPASTRRITDDSEWCSLVTSVDFAWVGRCSMAVIVDHLLRCVPITPISSCVSVYTSK